MQHFRQKEQAALMSTEHLFQCVDSGLFCNVLVAYVWFAGWSIKEESQAITGRVRATIL